MRGESLEDAIRRAGSPVELLRNSSARPHGFPVQPEFTNWRTEQAAWRESCVLFDQSHHMTDLYLSGPDAQQLLSDLGVNSFEGFAPGMAKQYVATNSSGHLIGDAILFHLDDDLFDLVGHSTVADWLEYNVEVGEYRVAVERDDNSLDRPAGPPSVFRYELQGPTADALLHRLTGAPVPNVGFFRMAEFTIAGHHVRGLRHGMAGRPGFELFGPWQEGHEVLDAIIAAGHDFGLVRAGAKAYATANLESGWIPSPPPALFDEDMAGYREWLRADALGSLGGSVESPDIRDYYLTPYEVGYGRIVRFDHDFRGREALEREAEQPTRRKVTLVWNPDDLASVHRSLFQPGLPAKYMDLPKSRYAFFQADSVLRDSRVVGMSMDLGYVANEHAFVSLATLDIEHTRPGTEVAVVWGEPTNSRKPTVEAHRAVEVRATVAPSPFVQDVRDHYRAS